MILAYHQNFTVIDEHVLMNEYLPWEPLKPGMNINFCILPCIGCSMSCLQDFVSVGDKLCLAKEHHEKFTCYKFDPPIGYTENSVKGISMLSILKHSQEVKSNG